MIRSIRLIMLFLPVFLFNGCIVPYYPEPAENEELLIVEGMISDQHETYTIKLSKSVPLWKTSNEKPLVRSKVWISDDIGRTYFLKEILFGTYVTDSSDFKGTIGRTYTLHIRTSEADGNLNYESFPMEMKPVPPIDSIYYRKKTYGPDSRQSQGCQIFLDTHDPLNKSKFYRWKYSETWEFHLPFDVKNKVCWRTEKSSGIFLKNTLFLAEDKVTEYPLTTITNPVDRLSIKYSIQVKQFSLTEDEYMYWDRVKNTSEQEGGLYDMVPAFIPNNVFCIENPNEKVLGYFSVSAVSTSRIFIKDNFGGINAQYKKCISDTLYGLNPIENESNPLAELDISIWILIDSSAYVPAVRYVTHDRQCADCRTRGSDIKPFYWDDDNK